MKKSLLALAVLGAFAGIAHAQTSVTLYGTIDGGVRNKTNVNAAGESQFTFGSGTYLANRWGVKGVEDLGSGLNAHFTIEGGFNTGTGGMAGAASGALFDRSAFVGLGGSWGSLDLGLQYSLAFKTLGKFDPFGFKYTGIIPLAGAAAGNQTSAIASGVGGTRFQNDIQYNGKFGPVSVGAEYAPGGVVGNRGNGSSYAGNFIYEQGPFSAGLVYTHRNPNISTTAVANYQSNRQWALGGAYNFGPGKIAGGYMDEKQDATVGDARMKTAWIGGSYNISAPMAVTAGYYQSKFSATGAADASRKLFIVGGTYALSKRTTFYADIDVTRFDGTYGTLAGFPNTAGTAFARPAGASPDRQTGFSIGLSHTF